MKEKIKIEPKWERSSDEIWSAHFEDITSVERMSKFRFARIKKYVFYYAAAVVVIALLPMLFTRNVVSLRGEHLMCTLPDGSVVNLNAESELSYNSLTWFISRGVKMNGEAYFEVEKGARFTVKTKNGDVRVLGTKFNVFSRGDEFVVACITGRVEVKSGNRVILKKNEGVKMAGDRELKLISEPDMENVISWKDDVFYFTSVPLNKVIEEVMRQYDVEIIYTENNNYIYTGNFSKESTIEEVLEIVSLPFGLRSEKWGNGYKLVSQ
jgi:ferric-dicitrate binding protein FerR (iron transport regulator)